MKLLIFLVLCGILITTGCTSSIESPLAAPKDPVIGHWGMMDGKTYRFYAFAEGYTGTEISQTIWNKYQNDFKWRREDNGTYTLFFYHKLVYNQATVQGNILKVGDKEYVKGFVGKPR